MTDQSAFYNFLRENGIGEPITNKVTNKLEMHFYEDDFKTLSNLGIINNCFDGGLVIGNSHKKGGIKIISLFNEPDIHGVFSGEMEGFEFVGHPIISNEMEEEYRAINNKKYSSQYKEFKIPDNCNVIDCGNNEFDIIVFHVKNQFVVNKYSSMNNLDKLCKLNKQYSC